MLVISYLYYPHGRGAELATWLYSKLLAANGIEIRVVTKQFPGEPFVEAVDERIVIYRFPMRTIHSRQDNAGTIVLLLSGLVRRLFRESDVVYLPAGWYSAILAAKRYRKPVVLHLHDYILGCPTTLMYDLADQVVQPSSLRGFLIYEIMHNRSPASLMTSCLLNGLVGRYYNQLGIFADAFVFVSKAQMNLVLSKFPQLRDKSRLIYNPRPDLPMIETKQKGLGYFGGRNFVKGINVLVSALRALNLRHEVDAYLTRTSVHPVTENFGNGVSINFLPSLSSDDLREIMTRLSVVVLPSLWPEPLPYSLIEGMLYGKLAIASAIGGIPEIVEGVGPGVRLVKPGDSGELAAAIDSFLAFDVKHSAELGARNREHILKRFDNDTAAASLIGVFREAVARAMTEPS